MGSPSVQRWAAFTTDPAGGNPAGVVLDAEGLPDAEMQRIATEVGYAETAFVTGSGRVRGIRYFSPVAEVPFCGHATVASAMAIAAALGDGVLEFRTPVGAVPITTRRDGATRTAAFTSVEPVVASLPEAALAAVLDLIGATSADLDQRYPPRLASAGNPHPVVVLAAAAVFDGFRFDPDAARRLLDAEGWPATITVLHHGDHAWEARNIFPVGTITEDPATGSAAAAAGAYLREIGAISPPARVVIAQGRHVGRPGLLTVDIPARGGITVSGTAVRID